MRIVLFLDLDDTIFQTAPKCPAGEAVHQVAYRRDGAPLSFMTRRQRALFETLARAATVIPTTARNLDAYRRVHLPFQDLAILDFGGVVLLPDGSLDPTWDAQIRPQVLATGPQLLAHLREVQRFIEQRGLDIHARVVTDFEMPLYLVAKHRGGDGARLQAIHEELTATSDLQRFFIHRNDNNLSLVPRFLGKEHAVRHVMKHHLGQEDVLTLGMADSLTDEPFLALCDYCLLPRDCQLVLHARQPERSA